jgi:hypothetical protein
MTAAAKRIVSLGEMIHPVFREFGFADGLMK